MPVSECRRSPNNRSVASKFKSCGPGSSRVLTGRTPQRFLQPAVGRWWSRTGTRRQCSYGPLKSVDPPIVKGGTWCRTPMDRFIVAGLETRGIRANPSADRQTLIRRLYFDLLGLPPSPKEVEAFIADP